MSAKDKSPMIYNNRNMGQAWIGERLKELPSKNKSGLAAFLGLDPSRITEILQGRRRIQVAELPKIAAYLEMKEESFKRLYETASTLTDAESIEHYRKLRTTGHLFGLSDDTATEDPFVTEKPPQSHSSAITLDENVQPNVRDEVVTLPFIDRRPVVEVLGITVGGTNGWFEFNGEVIDRVALPPGVSNADLIFGLYVEGDSMSPRFENGDLVYVHKKRKAVNGNDVIVELHSKAEGENGHCFIKRLVRRTPNFVVVMEFYPDRKEIEFAENEVKAIYRILTPSELMGIR
jgi:phage repressor protein C with HTH and peptisase S24 domain